MRKRADKDFREKIRHNHERFQGKVRSKDSKLLLEKDIPKNNNPKAAGSSNKKKLVKVIGKERQKESRA